MQRRLLLTALVLALTPAFALASEGKKEGEKPAVTYTALPSLNASVAGVTGQRTVLTVEVGLDIPDPTLNALAALSVPRLRNAYLEVLQAYGAGLYPGAAPNADLLAQRLQQSTDRVLGKPGARLLLGSVVVN